MKIVFDADNGLEAHMVVDLLAMQGMDAWIQGEYLPGGAGELPPAGLVKVCVEEADYPRARAIIAEWEAQGSSGEPSRKPAYRSGGAEGYVLMFLLGLAVGAVAVYSGCHGTSEASGNASPVGDEGADDGPGVRPQPAP